MPEKPKMVLIVTEDEGEITMERFGVNLMGNLTITLLEKLLHDLKTGNKHQPLE